MFARAALPQSGHGLNNRNVFPYSPGDWKSKIMNRAGLVSSEALSSMPVSSFLLIRTLVRLH